MRSRVTSYGFTIVELLASILIMSVMMIGVTKVYLTQTRTEGQQDLTVGTEENLRLAMDNITTVLRSTGCQVPPTTSSLFRYWFPWVDVFTDNHNPHVVQGTSGAPDTIYVASRFEEPVATLSAGANPGDTTLTVSTSSQLDATDRRLVQIGERGEFALVTAVLLGTVVIDTNPDPNRPGNQPLSRFYAAGTEIFRIDVVTFAVNSSGTVPRLTRNDNWGAGAQVIAEGIKDLQITPGTPYRVALTGEMELRDPVSGVKRTVPLSQDVALRN